MSVKLLDKRRFVPRKGLFPIHILKQDFRFLMPKRKLICNLMVEDFIFTLNLLRKRICLCLFCLPIQLDPLNNLNLHDYKDFKAFFWDLSLA